MMTRVSANIVIRAVLSWSLLTFAFALAPSTYAADLFQELKLYRQSSYYQKRTGLEVEFSGLKLDVVTKVLKNIAGGTPKLETEDYVYVDPTDGKSHHYLNNYTTNESPTLGLLVAKPEDNAPTLAELHKLMGDSNRVRETHVIEVVTAPLWPRQLPLFQAALNELSLRGGVGTTPEEAVAFQVNVEMGHGDPGLIYPEDVTTILRNYLRPQNRAAIRAHMQVPLIRQKYLGYPAPGFRERLFSPGYLPDWDRLYMDSMYRSVLEELKDPEAWTCTDNQARARVKAAVRRWGFEVVLPVLKWNFVRYSSLMMFMRPNEWLSKELIKTQWFHGYPILEFREPNNTFNAVAPVDFVLSFVAASQELGDFTAESLAAHASCERVLSH